MGLYDALYSVCCCQHYVIEETDEKDAILRTSVCAGSEPGSECGEATGKQDQKLWEDPQTSPSLTEPDSDGELYAFIVMRNQADKDTEEWEKLNYDIHTLKYARREVNTRWKKILLLLGYQNEVDSLLAVNKQSALRDPENLARTKELLQTLWEDSSLFPEGFTAPDKYLFIMDRLVSLDSGEDFVKLAKTKYPKK